VDLTSRYLELARRGRAPFLASAAPASLLRRRGSPRSAAGETAPPFFDFLEAGDATTSVSAHEAFEAASAQLDAATTAQADDLEVHPLVKKPGAAFADMITVGRTANNDVVLGDVTVSRFHAFFRRRGDRWILCDAGSKNGTRLDSEPLAPRTETPLRSGAVVRVGDIEATFYVAEDLYEVLRQKVP
jgi:hypothetical protein